MRFLFLPLLLVGCFAPHALAERTAADASTDDRATATATECVERLESPHFRDRAEATRKLFLFGIKAIDLLEQTVLTGGLEASSRAIGVLQSHYQSEDHQLKEAATASLQRIAASQDNPHWRTADQTLNPVSPDDRLDPRALRLPLLQLMRRAPAAAPPAPRLPAAPIPAPRLPAPPNPALQLPAQARGFAPQQFRVQIKITNGRRNISIANQGKTIRVIDRGDTIEVEKDDGQGTITKSTYKDRKELQEKDEESDRILQKYGWPAETP